MRSWLRVAVLTGLILIVVPATVFGLRSLAAEADSLVQVVMPRALRVGDSGEQVAALQRILKETGFDPGPVDGLFGPLTEGAVRRAQASLSLQVDGLAGRLTVGALREKAAAGATSEPAAAPTTAPEPETTAHSEIPAPPELVERVPAAWVLNRYRRGSGVPSHSETGETAVAGETTVSPDTGLVMHRAVPAMAPAVTAAGRAPQAGEFALTFNGSPEPELLPKVLAALARYDMKATFFITGEMAEARPELVARLAEAGHELGNGGYTGIDMARLTPVMMEAQIKRTQNAIAAAAGVRPGFFRPPLGRSTEVLAQSARRLRLSAVLWDNVGARDEAGLTPAELTDMIVGAIRPGGVVMLHQDRPDTVAALETLLEELRRRGYSSVGLTALDSGRQ